MATVSQKSTTALDALLSACRQVLRRWGDRGVQAGYLYGSVLGLRWREDSDIDIAVLDAASQKLDWAEQSRLMVDLEKAVGSPVDLRMLRECSVSHQQHVFEQGAELWIGDETAVREYRRATCERYELEHEANKKPWRRILKTLSRKSPAGEESGLHT